MEKEKIIGKEIAKLLGKEIAKLYTGGDYVPVCFKSLKPEPFFREQYFIHRGKLTSVYEIKNGPITGQKFTPPIDIFACISDFKIWRMLQDILSGNFFLGEPVKKTALSMTKWKEVDTDPLLKRIFG